MCQLSVALMGVVKITPAVRRAAELDDRTVFEQMIVDVMGVGIEKAAIMVVLEKRVDALRRVIAAKVEDVEGMVAIADIVPHLPGQRLARNRGIEEGHLGGVGVQRLGVT